MHFLDSAVLFLLLSQIHPFLVQLLLSQRVLQLNRFSMLDLRQRLLQVAGLSWRGQRQRV